MILEQDAKRLSIFAYYDADGLVDDYVIYLLEQMKQHCTQQIVMVNGTLQPEAEERLRKCCNELLLRPNEGFDVTAYKEAYWQAKDKTQYDEILFFNQTVFGPVCPLSAMFDDMNRRDVDFWGLTRHKGARKASWDNDVSIAPHLQSYFFAVRKSMFDTQEFRDYWDKMPQIETYWDAVSKHEVMFTEHFAALGYHWESYIDTEDLEEYNDYPLMGMPTEVLGRGCPFIKRKSFLCGRYDYSTVPQGAAAQMLFDWVREKTQYPIKMILQNLLRTVDVATLQSTLTLAYDVRSAKGRAGKNVAVLWFATEQLAPMLLRAAQALQRDTAMICLFATQALHKQYESQLLRNVKCVVTPKNGAEYLFTTLWDKVSAYENVLYLHNGLPQLLEEFADATTLGTAVESLVPKGCDALLSEYAEFGAIVPIPPVHQENLALGINWPQIAPGLKQPLEQAGIRVPLGETGCGFAVRGGMFFARVEAVRPLASFPFADIHFEGTYPAWEYLVPLAVQSSGYLTVTSCTREQAYVAMSNHLTLLRDMTAKWVTPRMTRCDQLLFRQQGILDFYQERRFQMTLEQAFSAKLTLKQKIWICAQIFLKPETFAKLHKGKTEQPTPPPDDLE